MAVDPVREAESEIGVGTLLGLGAGGVVLSFLIAVHRNSIIGRGYGYLSPIEYTSASIQAVLYAITYVGCVMLAARRRLRWWMPFGVGVLAAAGNAAALYYAVSQVQILD